MGFVPGEKGRFWVGTTNGLINFDPNNNQFIRYQHDETDPNSLSGNVIWTLYKDSNDYLWIATDGGGLSLYDHVNKRFNRYMHQSNNANSLNSNVVRSIFEDKGGDIWVGNFPTGINYFDRSSTAVKSYSVDEKDPHSLSHNSVLTVKIDEQQNMWLGTDGGGLNYFDTAADQFKIYKHDPDDSKSISSNAILSSYIDKQGVLWAGTWGGGLFFYNKESDDFSRLPFDYKRPSGPSVSTSKSLNSAHVWCIYEDSFGFLWVCTHSGGISKYERDTKIFTHYTPNSDDDSSISGGHVWTVFEDSNKRFWVGSASGLDVLDRNENTFEHFTTDPNDIKTISNNSVLSIYEDSEHRLWFGTDAGLNLYDDDTQSFTVINKKDGLVDDAIRSIIEDDEGLLWLGTLNGVSSLDPESKVIKNYNRDAGKLVGGFNKGAAEKSRQGNVVFGGVKGLRIYKTDELKGNKSIPSIVLTDFKIFSDSVVIGAKDGILSKTINETKVITLDYTKSMFVINFAALNYRDNGKNQYKYKLDGFDNEWIVAGNQRSAKYTNLDSGRYTFTVVGTNNDGLWNDVGKSISIVQLPPPWKTWWAFILYTLVILGALFWFIYAQGQKRKVIEQQNKLLEQKVSERTLDLRKKNQDIQGMLSSMHQGLFMVEADGTINPEYSAYLEMIFEVKAISGGNISDLLFSTAEIGSDNLNQIKEAINAMVGEDEINFCFNEHLFIDEYQTKIAGNMKHLHLDWNPIIVDGEIDKLMVTVRDETQLKLMEKEAEQQKKEIDMIMQLLTISYDRYIAFEKSNQAFIKENRSEIEASNDYSDDLVALLFRNMHTIKGNSRTFNLSYLSNAAHDAESTYSEMKQAKNSQWDKDKLIRELNSVEKIANEYAHVYYKVLGKGELSQSGSVNTLDEKNCDNIRKHLDSALQAYPDLKASGQLKPIQELLDNLTSVTLETSLSDVVGALPSIAQELEKLPAEVSFKADNVRLNNSACALINNIFSHLLRNSMDHGIETPDERQAKGKSLQGHILLETKINKGLLNIILRDDGKGLNIKRLFEKGVEIDLWKANDKPELNDIAKVVFSSGVSTKDQVSDISGRGVGMDSVKQFLLDVGGDIEINLLDTSDKHGTYLPVEMIVILPSKLFIEV